MERRKDRVEKEKDKSKKKSAAIVISSEEPTPPPGWNDPLDLPKWKGYGAKEYTKASIGFDFLGTTFTIRWKKEPKF